MSLVNLASVHSCGKDHEHRRLAAVDCFLDYAVADETPPRRQHSMQLAQAAVALMMKAVVW